VEKSPPPDFSTAPPALGNPAKDAGFPHSHSDDDGWITLTPEPNPQSLKSQTAVKSRVPSVSRVEREYVGRYIRRPPVAEHRLTRATEKSVQYMAKDTRNNRQVSMRYSNEKFVYILKQQVPDRGRHNMRYFGLLAPRSKARN